MLRIIFISIILFFNFVLNVNSEIINDVIIKNNIRVPKTTILTFGNIKIGSDYSEKDLNNVLKNLYETNFFSDIEFEVKNNVLILEINEMGLLAKKNFLDINEMNKIDFSDKSTVSQYEKNSFVYSFLSSMRQRLNDPLGKRKKAK